MRRPRPRRLRRWSLGFLALAALAITVMHLPFARALLGQGGGCPFGMDRAPVSSAERQARRHTAMQRLRGEVAAPSRPAGAFSLGVTTRRDVLAWAAARAAPCQPGRDKVGLACPAGARGHVYLDFDPHDVLVGLMSMTYVDGAAEAATELAALRSSLQTRIGAPSRATDDATASYLSGRPLRQARAEYRRANYFASLSATNLGRSGYLVSQVYQAID